MFQGSQGPTDEAEDCSLKQATFLIYVAEAKVAVFLLFIVALFISQTKASCSEYLSTSKIQSLTKKTLLKVSWPLLSQHFKNNIVWIKV